MRRGEHGTQDERGSVGEALAVKLLTPREDGLIPRFFSGCKRATKRTPTEGPYETVAIGPLIER
jgi:hypothetical protein